MAENDQPPAPKQEPPAPLGAPTGPIVRTADFLLDRLGGAADEAALRRWLADPRVTTPFTRPPPRLDEQTVARLVAAFDGRTGLLLAIRAADGGDALGFYLLRADPPHRTLRVSRWGRMPTCCARAAVVRRCTPSRRGRRYDRRELSVAGAGRTTSTRGRGHARAMSSCPPRWRPWRSRRARGCAG